METQNKQSIEMQPYSEHEVISAAEEVLGIIPNWYWKHKEVIEKNRLEQEQWTSQVVGEINELLQKLEHLRQ